MTRPNITPGPWKVEHDIRYGPNPERNKHADPMKHTCPNCLHVHDIKPEMQTEGGKARWKGVSKEARSDAMRAAVVARWAKSKAKA